jgi:transposase
MSQNCAINYGFFVGIDVSKQKFDAGILDSNGEKVSHKVFKNNRLGFEDFLTWTKVLVVDEQTIFVMEHTGLYSRLLWFFLQDNSCSLWMESGFEVKRGMGLAKGKNDKKDSYRIAEHALNRRHKIKITPDYDENLVLLHDLLSNRNRLVTDLNRIETPLSEMKEYGNKLSYDALLKVNSSAIKGLKCSIKEIEEAINELISTKDDWQKNIELASSVIGIGKWACLWILVYTRNFSKEFNSRKFASMAGVAPFESSSGSSIRNGSHNSHFSHKFLKGILHTAAMAAIRFNPAIKEYKEKKKKEGKKGFLVMNNIKNKILHQVFAVVRSREIFKIDYKHPMAA